jgi:hypothetical protein
MKDNQFLHDTIKRFGDGLAAAMDAGSDTFSFEFDPNDWPEDKPLMIQVAQEEPDKTMTLVVLIRPKYAADPMLAVMQEAREEMLRRLAAQQRPGATKTQLVQVPAAGEAATALAGPSAEVAK